MEIWRALDVGAKHLRRQDLCSNPQLQLRQTCKVLFQGSAHQSTLLLAPIPKSFVVKNGHHEALSLCVCVPFSCSSRKGIILAWNSSSERISLQSRTDIHCHPALLPSGIRQAQRGKRSKIPGQSDGEGTGERAPKAQKPSGRSLRIPHRQTWDSQPRLQVSKRSDFF